VVDGAVVTSRMPADLPAFIDAMIGSIARSHQAEREAIN
jgi:hypothetical protein